MFGISFPRVWIFFVLESRREEEEFWNAFNDPLPIWQGFKRSLRPRVTHSEGSEILTNHPPIARRIWETEFSWRIGRKGISGKQKSGTTRGNRTRRGVDPPLPLALIHFRPSRFSTLLSPTFSANFYKRSFMDESRSVAERHTRGQRPGIARPEWRAF